MCCLRCCCCPATSTARFIEIGAALGDRVDELAADIAAAIKADVTFYRQTEVVTDDELLRTGTETTRFAFAGLHASQPFDTSPAFETGSLRAASGVPLPAVMDAFRVSAHHIWNAMVDIARTTPLAQQRGGAARDGADMACPGRIRGCNSLQQALCRCRVTITHDRQASPTRHFGAAAKS